MRSFSNQNRDYFEETLHRIVEGACAMQGITADVEYRRNYPRSSTPARKLKSRAAPQRLS